MAGRIPGIRSALGFNTNKILFCHSRYKFLNIFTVSKDLLAFLLFVQHESRAKFEAYGG